MKLLCDISVGNRLAPNLKRKSAKSTLALCKQPKCNEFCVILFTAQNKNGTKYSLLGNIQQIFTRCVNEGKTTIQFKQPPHDLYIKADPIQLKSYLHLLKLALENKVTDKDLAGYSGITATPIAKKHIPQKKLYITSRAEYPIKGFPKSLEELHINNIQRCSLDKGILGLRLLKILDLSINLIETLPEDLNRLDLEELNLSENQLGKCSPKEWLWMGGHLSRTLKVLNMRNNGLKYLPNQIKKLYNLRVLHVDNNQLTFFPPGIGGLKALRIFTASHNLISSLPGTMKIWHLQQLDLTSNCFNCRTPPTNSAVANIKPLPPCSLKEYSARKVLLTRIPYTPRDLPLTLINYLDNAQYCVCGKACFDVHLTVSQMFYLETITDHLTTADDESTYVPMDCCFCSRKCYVTANYFRMRSPVI